MVHAKLLGTVVHHLGEACKVAADVYSCDVCSFAGGLQHHRTDNVVVADLLVWLNIRSRSASFKKLVVGFGACACKGAFERLYILIFLDDQQ